MRLFNSFQLVAVFACLPFLISWVHGAEFQYAGAAFWAALVVYIGSFIAMWVSIYDSTRKDGPFDW